MRGPTRRCSEREPADSLRDKSNVIGGWLPSLTFSLAAFLTMKIPTGLLPFLCWICLGAAVLAGPRIFVKGAGPEADRKRRLFRIWAAVYVAVMTLLAAAWLLSQK